MKVGIHEISWDKKNLKHYKGAGYFNFIFQKKNLSSLVQLIFIFKSMTMSKWIIMQFFCLKIALNSNLFYKKMSAFKWDGKQYSEIQNNPKKL